MFFKRSETPRRLAPHSVPLIFAEQFLIKKKKGGGAQKKSLVGGDGGTLPLSVNCTAPPPRLLLGGTSAPPKQRAHDKAWRILRIYLLLLLKKLIED